MMVAMIIRFLQILTQQGSYMEIWPLSYLPPVLASCLPLWEALHNLKLMCRFTIFPGSVGLTWLRFSTAVLGKLSLVFP